MYMSYCVHRSRAQLAERVREIISVFFDPCAVRPPTSSRQTVIDRNSRYKISRFFESRRLRFGFDFRPVNRLPKPLSTSGTSGIDNSVGFREPFPYVEPQVQRTPPTRLASSFVVVNTSTRRALGLGDELDVSEIARHLSENGTARGGK